MIRSGSATLSGTANNWPFLFKGLEKEFTDPGPLYYSGGGQFYSSQLVRSMSEVGQTSSSGPGGPSGHAIAGPSGGGQQSYWSWVGQQDADLLKSLFYPDIGVRTEGTSFLIPVGPIVQGIESFISFFDWLLGGSDTPPTPRQLLHNRHPLYPDILGVPDGLIPTEASEGTKFCSDPHPCRTPPLHKISPAPPSACSQYDAECAATPADSYACAAGDCCTSFGNNATANCVRGCLLNFEAAIQASGSGANASRLGAHTVCYTACGLPPNALNIISGAACQKLAPNM
jgi:hypothetical protein